MTKHDKVEKGISQSKNVIYRSNVTMYFEIQKILTPIRNSQAMSNVQS